ncbi:MAG: hypothetical protein QNK51_05740 [Chitinophagales bacterium]|jgi:hypothetical protein|tara:strand:- start:6236 stop:6502 length:267 start_codon:yes stop_codon:yes gene_type:complete
MKETDIFIYDDALASIEKVDASPYLLSRIRQRLKNRDALTKSQKCLVMLSFSVLLAVNVVAINLLDKSTFRIQQTNEFEYLLPQNNLY